jgi:type II secretory pathway pseudopilin PulG
MTAATALPPVPSRRAGRRPGSAAGQRGAATLIIVLLLFFVVSLVAAYTGRNLIFEQRTSANQYRSTQAMEAAQAGVDWTLAMLNGGRIDANCQPSANANDNTFRDRYLSAAGNDDTAIGATGAITLRTRADGGGALLPACVFDGDSDTWQCSCPSNGATGLPGVASPLARPMFRIRLIPSTRPDLISIESAGCTRPDNSCVSMNPVAPAGDALAVVTAMITIRGGLFTPPGAPVMARGAIDASAGPLQVVNADPVSNGITAIAGGGVAGNVQPTSLPGTPPETSVAPPDAQLAGLADGRRMFHTVFGLQPETFRQQAAAVRVDCAGGCTAATVAPLVADNPGRVIWVDGSLTVDGDIGSAQVPALVVATEGITLASGTVVGVLYSRAADWDLGVGNTVVRGALIAENRIVGSGGQSIQYDPAVLNRLRRGRGSFVPVPGGWKDWSEV